MHQTTMFNRPAAPIQAPPVEIYDINMIANQFAAWNFGLGQPYDQHTPQIALLTINEIQQQALRGHPIRVGMFDILSQNSFNNPAFQDLVYTILMRIGHGITNGEWRNLDMAVTTVLPRAVKCCASSMASQDPQFMATLPASDAAAVRENAELWNYLVALAQGQAQYIPFNQMANSGLSGVSGSTQAALQDARALRGNSAGAFVETVSNYDGLATGRYNNNGGQTAGRYGRRSEKIFGKLEGSMQEALQESGVAAQVQTPGNSNYQTRMRRPDPTQGGVTTDVKKFDSDVTDFSKSLDIKTEEQAPVPEPKTLFTIDMAGQVMSIIRECKEGISAWKSSKVQRFHPAWCKRTHTVRYFESKDGIVIAVLQALTEEQKELAMNYDAHAIDPTKGQPEPSVPQRPVRPEAKVMYAPADKVTVNVIVAKKFGAEEDVSGCIRSVRLAAEMSEKIPDAYVRMALVNAPIIYPSAIEAQEDATVINAVAFSKDFAEAASHLSKVRSALARKTIGDTLVKAVNRAIECELGVGVRISDFEEDGPQIIQVLEDTQGELIGDKMRTHQPHLLQANVRVVPATDMKTYADATLTTEDQEELSEDMLNRVLFLQRNVCAVWVNYTDDEMAIGVPDKGAAVIQAESLGTVYKIAQAVYTEAIGSLSCSEQYLVTKDSVRYRLHAGLMNKSTYLLSKEVK